MKVKKLVIRPLMKVKPGIEYCVRITGPMHLGKKIDDKKEPATLMHIDRLPDGTPMQMIAGKLLKDALNDEYPGEKYVGKCFAFQIDKDPENPEKRYNLLTQLNEIEPDESQKTSETISHGDVGEMPAGVVGAGRGRK